MYLSIKFRDMWGDVGSIAHTYIPGFVLGGLALLKHYLTKLASSVKLEALIFAVRASVALGSPVTQTMALCIAAATTAAAALMPTRLSPSFLKFVLSWK